MKTEKELSRIGRNMSGLLRHFPEKANLVMDSQGYVEVKSLCKALKINIEELDWIVDNNNKKRFEYDETKSKIRASQGHSIEIDLKLGKIIPPDILYHGTSYRFSDSIYDKGLTKCTRNHVHLTDDLDTAINVGRRKLKLTEYNVWVINIDAKQMNEDGYVFYKSKNGVYLTEHVPSKYFINESRYSPSI